MHMSDRREPLATVVDNIDAANRGRRVLVKGRIIAECYALSEAENHSNAQLIAAAFNLHASAPPEIQKVLETLAEVDEILQRTDFQIMIGGNTTRQYLHRIAAVLRPFVAAAQRAADARDA